MTHQGNTTNWVIQGHNGQSSQVVKIQSGGKSITGIMTSAIGQVKIPQQTFTTTTSPRQIVKTMVASPKFVTKAVPIHVTNATLPKGAKAVRIVNNNQLQQMQGKIISSTTPQKIQFTDGSITNVQTVQTQQVQTIHQSPNVQNQKNVSPHILGRKRPDTLTFDYTVESKRSRKSDKVGKGLRHFSMKVCEKVRTKGTTTYNEVADELVGEFINPSNNSLPDQQYDQKNIRRRVYDALNVLMAMNIISKEKKEIKWIGLPTNSLQECIQLEQEKMKKLAIIREKKKQLQELILNQIAFKNLAQRNKQMEEMNGKPALNSYIQLPFIVVNTSTKTRINCNVSDNKMEYVFEFNDRFEVNDDAEILKMIGMHKGLDTGECTPENLARMRTMVPPSLEDYVTQMARGGLNEEDYLTSESAGTSAMPSVYMDAIVETHLDEENSRQSSSYDNLDYSDEDGDSDMSSDTECN